MSYKQDCQGDGIGLGWGRDHEPLPSRAPVAAHTSAAGSGPILLCMGLFSPFYVPALRCTARGVSKTHVNALMRRCTASGIRDRCFRAYGEPIQLQAIML